VLRPHLSREAKREEERELINEQLKTYHQGIMKRGIFTKEQIIEDPERYLIS
jgi:hypothetical protein